MNSDVTSQRSSHITALSVLLLAFAVFAWGVQYKLSLYDLPGSPSATIPHAKLLSQKERPVSLEGLELVSAELPQVVLIGFSGLLIGTICLGVPRVQTSRLSLTRNENSRRRRHFRSSFFSFRPPPGSDLV
jgi:hypothetical protein